MEAGYLVLHSNSPEETFTLGRALGALLEPGDVVCLVGELGSGKTVLAQGIAAGIGVDPREGATSPTFTLVHEYRGRHRVYHIDLYRLDRLDEILDLGWDEWVYNGGVVVIEWAEKAGGLLPEERFVVEIEISGGTARKLALSASGARSQQRLRELARSLQELRD